MDIKNFTQFVNLLITTQTVKFHPSFDKLLMCMNVYNSLCNCGGSKKSEKEIECNRIYRECIGSVDSVKSKFFQSTSDNNINFYINDVVLIKTIFR